MEFTYTDSLKNEVPKEIRLEVYKRAKNLIENWGEDTFNLDNPGLCLLLPCILYNCETYLSNGNCESGWLYADTVIGFPELTLDDIEDIRQSFDRNKKRLELVTNWIKQLS